MNDDAAVLLVDAGQEPGNIFEHQQRDVECVAEADEARTFPRGVDVENASQKRRLIGHDADRMAIQADEADHEIASEMLMHFEEVAFIRHDPDEIAHFIRLIRILGDEAIELRPGYGDCSRS